jgi:hypothetical protein
MPIVDANAASCAETCYPDREVSFGLRAECFGLALTLRFAPEVQQKRCHICMASPGPQRMGSDFPRLHRVTSRSHSMRIWSLKRRRRPVTSRIAEPSTAAGPGRTQPSDSSLTLASGTEFSMQRRRVEYGLLATKRQRPRSPEKFGYCEYRSNNTIWRCGWWCAQSDTNPSPCY